MQALLGHFFRSLGASVLASVFSQEFVLGGFRSSMAFRPEAVVRDHAFALQPCLGDIELLLLSICGAESFLQVLPALGCRPALCLGRAALWAPPAALDYG